MTYLGFHGQRPIPDWLEAVKILPAKSPLLAVDDLHMLRDAKLNNPGVLTIFRKKVEDQNFTPDYNTAKEKARAYFNKFVDGTWQQQELWRYVDVIKDWNEYVASSDSEAQRQLVITWLQAVTAVWNGEYRGKSIVGYRDIPLALTSTAIGNDIDWRYAQIAADTGNILSYHNYTHFDFGLRDTQDWRYHSGRWAYMDQDFVSRGIKVRWISTEGGPYQGVYDGWKSSKVLSGSLARYIDEVVKYQLLKTAEWNATHENRYLGSVFFTFGQTGGWPMYELTASEMVQLAQAIKNGVSIMTWQSELWSESVNRQAISLNPNAALQAAIFADGFTPVESEFWYTPSDGKQRAAMAAEHLETGERRVYYAVVPAWDVVKWFTDPN